MTEEYEKKQAQRSREVYKATTLSFKNSVMKAAQSRSDDTAKTIVARIGFEHDLVAAEAKYHNDCFEKIFSYIESSDDCRVT